MRPLLYLLTAMAVMGLAFWAYRENYRTQSVLDEMQALQNEIAGLRDNLGVLRAEWAYLNRPDRLRALVDMNFERLKLVPVGRSQFGGDRNVDYPPPPRAVPAEPAADGVASAPAEDGVASAPAQDAAAPAASAGTTIAPPDAASAEDEATGDDAVTAADPDTPDPDAAAPDAAGADAEAAAAAAAGAAAAVGPAPPLPNPRNRETQP